jgi:hypothetical protein
MGIFLQYLKYAASAQKSKINVKINQKYSFTNIFQFLKLAARVATGLVSCPLGLGLSVDYKATKAAKGARHNAQQKALQAGEYKHREEEEEKEREEEATQEAKHKAVQDAVKEAVRASPTEEKREQQRKGEKKRAKMKKQRLTWVARQQGKRQPKPSTHRHKAPEKVMSKPQHLWAMIKINLFIKLIKLLSCPWCGSISHKCVSWCKVNSTFQTTVHFSSHQADYQFSVKFSSLTYPKHTQQHNTPSHLVFTWGLHGLGFKALKSVFALSGGILPISKAISRTQHLVH